MNEAAIVVGIDIGGTKTQMALACGGRIVAQRTLVTDEWRVRAMDVDARALASLAIELAGGEQPAALAVGAHGCDIDEACKAFQAGLSRHLRGRIRVVNDSELLVPAAGFSEGVGLVAGTGSIAVARSADGRMLAAGGWGWIIGDEGSAPSLVREAAKAIRRSTDDGTAPDALARLLLASLGTTDQTRLGGILGRMRSAADVGRHAPPVFAAAAEGSSLAKNVIDAGGRALAQLVAQVVRCGATKRRVVAGGSVIVNQPMLWRAFVDEITQILPETEPILLRRPPVIGALLLARQALQPQTPIEALEIAG